MSTELDAPSVIALAPVLGNSKQVSGLSGPRLVPVAPASPCATEKRPRFRFHSVADLQALPDPEWLVAGFLPERSIGMLFGPPGVGKSFVALDLALFIAASQRWHGHVTKSGAVLYVFAEGQAGAKKRLNAWLQVHATERTPDMTFLTDAVPLTDAKEVGRLVDELTVYVEGKRLSLVVIDTLAQASAGADENNTKDMQPVIAALQSIRDKTGATVLVLHHPTKNNPKVERGSSSLRGAMDVVLSLSPVAGGIVVSTEKQKDAEPAAKLHLRLQRVALAVNRRGEEVTSCVVVEADSSLEPCQRSVTTDNEDRILMALRRAPEGLRFKELRQAVGLSESNAASILKRLAAAGRVTKGPGKRDPWMLAPPLAQAA
jgi:AAA domain/MarR family